MTEARSLRSRWGIPPYPRLGAALASAAILALAAPAAAQVGFGQPGGAGSGLGQPGAFGGSPGKSGKKPAKKVPEGEETHAASNVEGAQSLQTQEPTLPQNPLEVPPAVKERIGTDDTREATQGLGSKTERFFFPPFYQEKSGSYRFRTIFPLWAERTMPNDRASIFGFYYNRRSPNVDSDVLFPLFWRLRDHETTTTAVFPFVHREVRAVPPTAGAPAVVARHDNWLFPLLFEGGAADGSGYFHVPLLLSFTQHTARDGLDVVGPMFCKWKGGPACDPRTTDSIDLGLPPFYFYGRDENREYEVIPPLLHYYHYSDIGDKTTNLWGPVLRQHSPESDVTDVLPFFWHSHGKNESSTTLFPLFHYSYKGNERLIVNPLFVSATGEHGESTLATWGYARYRGRTQLDMITPFYWHYQDPDIGLDRKLLFPFFYKNTSPRSNDLVVFPFYGHFNKPGISETTWITPVFRHVTDVTGWETNLFPLVFMGRKNDSNHLVVAPLLWDFSTPHSRQTVMPPFYFRFADDKAVTQVAFNTYYHEKKVDGGTDWEFHFFPLFSYGQSPTGRWWNLMYGMAGYAQDGTSSRVKVLYIPFKLSD